MLPLYQQPCLFIFLSKTKAFVDTILWALNLKWINATDNDGITLKQEIKYDSSTVFKNHPKCAIWGFQFWHFPPTFVLSIKSDLSGNTIWPQTSGFQKLVKMDYFWLIFVNSKCRRSSLRSQFWMWLFLWNIYKIVLLAVYVVWQGKFVLWRLWPK